MAKVAFGGRSAMYRAIQFAYDIVERGEGKDIRENIRDKLNAASDKFIEAGNYDKKEARKLRRKAREQNDAASRVIAAQIMYLASYTGNSAQELLSSRAFDIIADTTQTGGLERDKKGKIKRDEFGNYEESNGDFVFVPEKKDSEGKVVDHAKNLIYFYRGHNISTMIHEPGHFFLQVMRDLYRDGKLEGGAKQDWDTLAKYLKIENVDFKLLAKDEEELTPEEHAKWKQDRDKWRYAQEKFATSGEKFIMVGEAPKMKLRRAFEVLKRYMGRVYGSVGRIETTMYGTPLRYDENGNPRATTVDDVIQLVDADRQARSYKITSEAMEFLSKVYGGTPKGEGSKTQSSTESISGAGESEAYHQSSLGKQQSIRDVLDIMQTEQGRKNAGNVWVDYARVSPEEAKRISEATGLDINDKYTHSIIGSAIIHTLNRHGVGNEQRQEQIPITNEDLERIPYIIQNADETRLGTDKTTGNLNDTIVYQKRINGHVLIVEEVRRGRKKLAFHTMRKAKAGYIYDLALEGQPIVNENAKSEGVNVRNGLTPEVQLPNALSNIKIVHGDNSIVNDNNTDTYHQTFMRADNFTYNGKLTLEARKQMDAIRDKYYGTAQWLKAPNGQKTKLTERQWLAVRTENFKRWFGDWENDPANASKVLDENGEPMVVRHGYRGKNHKGFSFFHIAGGTEETAGTGAFFSSTRTGAEFYVVGESEINPLPVFPEHPQSLCA